jgi:hypothetical protein
VHIRPRIGRNSLVKSDVTTFGGDDDCVTRNFSLSNVRRQNPPDDTLAPLVTVVNCGVENVTSHFYRSRHCRRVESIGLLVGIT